ncbi:MAG: hypothetical protein ABSG91_24020 [Syntrophobacteraceae bacterium]|jgi:hypothetical protein
MYSNDMTMQQWQSYMQGVSQQLNTALEAANDAYKKWYVYSYGLSDTQVAAQLGQTSGVFRVDDIASCIGVFNDLYCAYTNVSGIPQNDRKAILLKMA